MCSCAARRCRQPCLVHRHLQHGCERELRVEQRNRVHNLDDSSLGRAEQHPIYSVCFVLQGVKNDLQVRPLPQLPLRRHSAGSVSPRRCEWAPNRMENGRKRRIRVAALGESVQQQESDPIEAVKDCPSERAGLCSVRVCRFNAGFGFRRGTNLPRAPRARVPRPLLAGWRPVAQPCRRSRRTRRSPPRRKRSPRPMSSTSLTRNRSRHLRSRSSPSSRRCSGCR